MNSLKTQWKKKAPEGFQQLVQQAQQLRLYLIHQQGPTSLQYCDDDGGRFKVMIGERVQCSCQTHVGHCVHSLHAMLKKFKVDPTNPIIWQMGYSDSEVSDLISGKFASKAPPPNILIEQVQEDKNVHIQKVQRQSLNEDSLCPICQEPMDENEPVTFCKKQCGNNFHINCLKIWVKQKGSNVSCPMCRQQMGANAWSDLLREEQEYVSRVQTHKAMCQGCHMKPVIGTIYQCVTCKNQLLCQKCFSKNMHSNHDHFFHRSRTDEQWKPIKRSQHMMSLWDENTVNNYNKYPYQPQIDFLIDCLKFEKKTEKENSLMIIGTVSNKDKIKCIICNQPDYSEKNLGRSNMKELKCGHYVDLLCLKQLEKNQFICPIDGVVQLEGYLKVCGGQKIKTQTFSSLSSNNQNIKLQALNIQKPPTFPQTEIMLKSPIEINTRIHKNQSSNKFMGEKLQQGRLQSLQQRQPDSTIDLSIGGAGRFNENTYGKKSEKKPFKINKPSSRKVERPSLQQQFTPSEMTGLISIHTLANKKGNKSKSIMGESRSRKNDQIINETNYEVQRQYNENDDDEIFVPFNG